MIGFGHILVTLVDERSGSTQVTELFSASHSLQNKPKLLPFIDVYWSKRALVNETNWNDHCSLLLKLGTSQHALRTPVTLFIRKIGRLSILRKKL